MRALQKNSFVKLKMIASIVLQTYQHYKQIYYDRDELRKKKLNDVLEGKMKQKDFEYEEKCNLLNQSSKKEQKYSKELAQIEKEKRTTESHKK